MTLLDLPKYEQVKRTIIEQIESEHYADGAPFPSESQLLGQFEVSRPTLIRALQELVRDGYLDRQQGRGTFVSSRWRSKDEAGSVLPVFLTNSVSNKVGDERIVHLQIFEGIQTGLSERQAGLDDASSPSYSLVMHQLPSGRLDDATTRFIDGMTPGIAIVVEPSFNQPLWSFLLERGWTAWGLNEPVDGGRCVFIDQERAGYLATRYLVEENRRRIALLNGPREAYWGFPARERGYRRALAEGGIAVDESLILEGEHALDSEAGRAMFQELHGKGVAVDGVVGATDQKAMGAMAAAMDSGLSVPRDLMFVGMNNIGAALSVPPLSSVDMPFLEVGRQAVHQAFSSSARKGSNAAPLQVCLQPTLIERPAT